MVEVTIRDIDDATERRLKSRARSNGRSVEDEARDILRAALQSAPDESTDVSRPRDLYEAIRRRIEPLGGVDLPDMPRGGGREPPDFSK